MKACLKCRQELADDATYCSFCGAAQRQETGWNVTGKVLRRSAGDYKIAGVCGGLGEYLGVDAALVRLIWIVLTIIPGAILLGVLAYGLAWLIMPAGVPGTRVPPVKRLMRSADRRVAGVCGGLADYFGVDPTAVRLLWIVLTVIPGFIICGVLAYIVAWLVMPPARQPMNADVAPATPAGG